MQMAMFIYTRIGVHAKSFNNPTFTEAQTTKILATSVGKVIFNEIILIHSHSSMNLVKQILKVKHLTNTLLIQLNWVKVDLKHTLKNKNLLNHSIKILGNIIAEVFNRFSITDTSMMLDRMKDLGFKFSSKAGITVGVADIVVLPDKQDILDEHEN